MVGMTTQVRFYPIWCCADSCRYMHILHSIMIGGIFFMFQFCQLPNEGLITILTSSPLQTRSVSR